MQNLVLDHHIQYVISEGATTQYRAILRRNICGMIIFGTDLVSERFSAQVGLKDTSKLENNIT